METLSKVILSSCSHYPWRANGNTFPVLLNPGILHLSPAFVNNVAAEPKNKETLASLFFSRRQRSKVIARVTRNSLIAFSCSLRAYLALRGSDHITDKSGVPWIYLPLQNPLPIVASFEVTRSPFVFAPEGRKTTGLRGQAYTSSPGGRFRFALPGCNEAPEIFHTPKYDCYGK